MVKAIAKARFSFSLDLSLLIIITVGDFGLATSSLAAVDPSDVSPYVAPEADMTLGRLLVADYPVTWLQFPSQR
jgi:hypothetical protein